jgi:hypothetical protein
MFFAMSEYGMSSSSTVDQDSLSDWNVKVFTDVIFDGLDEVLVRMPFVLREYSSEVSTWHEEECEIFAKLLFELHELCVVLLSKITFDGNIGDQNDLGLFQQIIDTLFGLLLAVLIEKVDGDFEGILILLSGESLRILVIEFLF